MNINENKISKINNRRYLGNKYRLLPFIKEIINQECIQFNSFVDLFAGTGAVSSAFTNKRIITNDILYSNYLCHITWFLNAPYEKNLVKEYIEYFNSIISKEENYMTQNFADTFFSYSVCSKIGVIREIIERDYKKNKLNIKEYAILITSLLYAIDKIANTCGHYDAYIRNNKMPDDFEMLIPMPNEKLNKSNMCYNEDANEIVKKIKGDVFYIDPPYNSRQYCDAYHLIENISRWEKPPVKGIARKMNRDTLKSKYCSKDAMLAFEDLIKHIKGLYIVVSYNNMGQKGNERSNARILDEDIFRIMREKGEVKVYSKNFKLFSTGKTKINDNEERLFVCRVKN